MQLSLDKTTSQNLASAALDYTTDYARTRKIEQVMFHFSQVVTETITITLDSAKGANYDMQFRSIALVAEDEYIWRPQGQCNLQQGDELHIECTNANGVSTCFVLVKSSELQKQ